MRVVLVMFDSLNRHFLPPYACDWTHAPAFTRLAERSVTFDAAYIGSMPCMPARREIHTGRYNFLHRSWGPIEPFDDSMPEILKKHGVHSHLHTDHYHYFEDGGATYHHRYSTWEGVRGQEGDAWIGQVADPEIPEALAPRGGDMWRQDWINRAHMPTTADLPQARTFRGGIDFLRRNHAEDNWFLQIETFDPHEPFFSHQEFKDLYPHAYDGPHFDWPPYRRVEETPEQVEHLRCEYAALLSMCDAHLNQVLDAFDELDLWDDTMLIVNTDHGFMLGEHDWWAKMAMPWYDQLARIPLFIWDPRSRKAGERRASLVQTIDLPATILEAFGVDRPPDMQGRPLAETVANDTPVREAGLFGMFGGHVNVTDGRYVYMRAPASGANGPLHEYTLMPTHMRGLFGLDELQEIEIAGPLPFTKGCQVMKTKARGLRRPPPFETMLFDTRTAPGQEQTLDDPAIESVMTDHLVRLMRETHAPPEQYQRLGLP